MRNNTQKQLNKEYNNYPTITLTYNSMHRASSVMTGWETIRSTEESASFETSRHSSFTSDTHSGTNHRFSLIKNLGSKRKSKRKSMKIKKRRSQFSTNNQMNSAKRKRYTVGNIKKQKLQTVIGDISFETGDEELDYINKSEKSTFKENENNKNQIDLKVKKNQIIPINSLTKTKK
jgi:hypothetical protein